MKGQASKPYLNFISSKYSDQSCGSMTSDVIELFSRGRFVRTYNFMAANSWGNPRCFKQGSKSLNEDSGESEMMPAASTSLGQWSQRSAMSVLASSRVMRHSVIRN